MIDDWSDQSRQIETKDEFVSFLSSFLQDCRQNGEAWENATLAEFLQAMLAWTKDSDGYYHNIGKVHLTEPDWRRFADMLLAARAYE